MITKEHFDRYEKVRKSGRYNMIMDYAKASREAGLNIDDYLEILFSYKEFFNEFYPNGWEPRGT